MSATGHKNFDTVDTARRTLQNISIAQIYPLPPNTKVNTLAFAVASLGGVGRTAPAIPSTRVTPERKKWCVNLQKNSGQRRSERKKVRGATIEEGDTRVKSIKVTVISKKGRQYFRKK